MKKLNCGKNENGDKVKIKDNPSKKTKSEHKDVLGKTGKVKDYGGDRVNFGRYDDESVPQKTL